MSVANKGKPVLPKTENESWGFYGTLHNYKPDTAKEAWDIALLAIYNTTGLSLMDCQIFLDSRHGRHFADNAIDNIAKSKDIMEAIQMAVDKWMAFKITRSTARHYGIPKGLPFLTGITLYETSLD